MFHKPHNNVSLRIAELKNYNIQLPFEEQIKNATLDVNRKYFKSLQWGFYSNEILKIKERLLKKSTPLKSISDLKINRGITTGLNKVFILSNEIAREKFKDSQNSEIICPVLKGADIKRWKNLEHRNKIIYSYTGIEIEKYPEVYEYLKENKLELENVYEAKNGQKQWYELRTCSYYESFFEEKLIWTRLSSINSFALSKGKEFSIDSTSFAVGKNLKYYCCLLNSSIVLFYFKLGGVIWGKDGIKWFGEYFDNIPVISSFNNKEIFNILFEYVYETTENPNSLLAYRYFEQIIDALNFELYFNEEIQLAGKEILKHLGNLKPISDSMSEEEKLAIIQSEFERLYDPNHPVRNNIETLDSVEEVRIIREALK